MLPTPPRVRGPILFLKIVANNFELKHGLINLVQNKQFFGHDKEDPHAHIRYFNKITSTMRVPNVPIATIKLMLFPFSIEGAARIWLEKEPPRSIQTWDDLVSKFINQFFPPSKTTNLRNEITRFQQRFDESFNEAWISIELPSMETFLDKIPRECLKIIESKSKVSSHTRAKRQLLQEDIVRALLLDKKNLASAPAPDPATLQSSLTKLFTCGGAHSHQRAVQPLMQRTGTRPGPPIPTPSVVKPNTQSGKSFQLPDLNPTCIDTRDLRSINSKLTWELQKNISLRGSEASTYNLESDFEILGQFHHMTANKMAVIDMAMRNPIKKFWFLLI
ncbi:reverse transcriptase domain-containing protein [Tanacetum coccineum]